MISVVNTSHYATAQSEQSKVEQSSILSGKEWRLQKNGILFNFNAK